MNAQGETALAARDWSIDEAIDLACRLAGQDAIGGFHVAIERRPTYAELLRHRRRAERCGLTVTVAAASLSLQPRQDANRGSDVESRWGQWSAWARRCARRYFAQTSGAGSRR